MNNETEAPDLLPCPFCGGKAELWRASEPHNRRAWISCMDRCSVLITSEHNTDAQAIATWNTRADLSDDKDARIAELEAAIKRQAGAAKTLRNSTLAEVQHIKDNERKEYLASKTLDSERDANAILTEENEALQARIAELEAELEDYQEMNKNQIAIIRQADKRGDGWKAGAEAAEAKLAKVEAAIAPIMLEAHGYDYFYETQFHAHVYETLSATIAELKGRE